MPSESERKDLGDLTASYHRNAGQVTHYLAERGIPREVGDTFLLGYVAEPTPGAGDEDYVGRLAIPYITPSGVCDIRYRTLIPGGPKYLSRPGAKARLYNVNDLQKISSRICICEGELDTIVASALCGLPAVGVPGANSWQAFFGLLFEHYQKVYVLADGDNAGRDFAKRVASQLDRAVVVNMPDGMDVNDLYLAEGRDGLRRRVGISE